MVCFFRYKWNGSKCSSYGATLKRECATNNSNKGILWRTISTILLVLVLMLSNVSCANTSNPATFVGLRIGNINNYCAVINLNGSFVDAEFPEEFIIETEHIKDFPEGLAGIIDDISISFNNPKIIAEGMNEKGNVVIAINEDCVATVGLEGKT